MIIIYNNLLHVLDVIGYGLSGDFKIVIKKFNYSSKEIAVPVSHTNTEENRTFNFIGNLIFAAVFVFFAFNGVATAFSPNETSQIQSCSDAVDLSVC